MSGMRVLAKRVVKGLALHKHRDRATVVFLNGDLGSGKTTFVQMLAQVLRARGRVLSPTFVFAHEHALAKSSPWRRLIHVDAYRIENARDVAAVGLGTYASQPGNLVVIEWGERIKKWLRRSDTELHFFHHTPKTRAVNIEFAHGKQNRRAKK